MRIDDGGAIETSFPGFAALMNGLGARISGRTKDWHMIIAVDGPAASGKGTLGAAAGRPVRLELSRHRLALSGRRPGRAARRRRSLRCGRRRGSGATSRSRRLADPALRGEAAGAAASKVGAIPAVRAALLDFQRAFARQPPGAVLDGRDIGTVVCPDADAKLFVTASPEVRAERRWKELLDNGVSAIRERVLQDMRERDARDSARSVAPLVPAVDAVVLDTSELDAEAAFAAAVDIISQRRPAG